MKVAAGYAIPTLQTIRLVAEQEGVFFEINEIPFMTTSYMFVYSFLPDGRMYMHDRDFKTREETTFQEVLEQWWAIKIADRAT